jgi:hypothetical protein
MRPHAVDIHHHERAVEDVKIPFLDVYERYTFFDGNGRQPRK